MASWGESKYRGQTSLNVPEAFGMNNKQALIFGAVLIGGIILINYLANKGVGGWFTPSPEDPNYMIGDPEVNIGVNYPVPTGGTFVHPEYLPPVRTYHLQ